MLGRRLSADFGRLQDRNDVRPQLWRQPGSPAGRLLLWEAAGEKTRLFCGTAPANLLPAAHTHVGHVNAKAAVQLCAPEGPSRGFIPAVTLRTTLGYFWNLM